LEDLPAQQAHPNQTVLVLQDLVPQALELQTVALVGLLWVLQLALALGLLHPGYLVG
jgi:hypothetical protein